MKEKKTHQIGVRLTFRQTQYLDQVVMELGLRSRSEGLQHILNKIQILGVK